MSNFLMQGGDKPFLEFGIRGKGQQMEAFPAERGSESCTVMNRRLIQMSVCGTVPRRGVLASGGVRGKCPSPGAVDC